MAGRLDIALRGLGGVALLAALALPAGAALEHRGAPLAPSHGRTPPPAIVWLAAERVYAEVAARTRALDGSGRTRVARAILEEADRAGLDPLLVVAMIQVESSFDPRVVSSAGAVGLMQLLGPTMREVAVRTRLASANPRDPVANVRAGTRYLAGLVRTFPDVELALMAYNAGPGRIRRHLHAGGVPGRFHSYPRSVFRERDRLRKGIAPSPGPERGLLLATTGARPALVAAHGSRAPAGHLVAAPLARGTVPAVLAAAASMTGWSHHPRRAPRPVEPDGGALPVALASSGQEDGVPGPAG